MNETNNDQKQKKKLFTIRIKVLIIICVMFLLWGLWPGSLSNFSLLINISVMFGMLYLLAVGVRFIFSIIQQIQKKQDAAKTSLLRFILATVIVTTTALVASLHIPLRISFYLCKSSFEPFVVSAPAQVIPKRLGIWNIDRHETDPRGGVYFRIGTEMEGLSADQVSHGFVYKPNSQGSPFGNARYYYSNLTGDWFYFRASDDW